MRIQYMSDLHMELYDNSRYLKTKEFDANGDVLVLAGDTFYLRDIIAPQKRFWNWASKNFQQVLLVPGNHEFYSNGDVTARGDSWQWMIRENVGYYYNKVVRIDDTDFILTTLWSRIPEQDMFHVQRGMNDFRQIMYDGRRFTPDDFNLEHEKCLTFLKQAVKGKYRQAYRCGYTSSSDIISGGSPVHGFRSKRSLCYRTGKLYCRQSH